MTSTPPASTPRTPFALNLIAAIIVIVALHFGREFFIPIALALCFHALLRPLVRGLEGWRLPSPAAAAIVVLGGLGIAVVGGRALSGPVSNWINKAPTSLAAARTKIQRLGRPLRQISAAAEGTADSGQRAAAPPPAPAPATPSAFGVPTPVGQLLGQATVLILVLIEVVVLLYLMLAAGDLFLRKLMKVLRAREDKRTASDILHDTEKIVARYLTITAAINVGQGAAVGVGMWLIGIPDPLIWGLLTFAAEFIPYIGGVVMVGLLLITGFTTFPSLGEALLAPAIYIIITTLQNNVVSPYVYGGRLKLNPLAVMVCVLFWWFVWGIPGVFLAIPITAMMKALGDELPRLKPLGEFLGD